MTQTKEGAKKATEAIYKKYGKDYYSRIGHTGGSRKVAKGFAALSHEAVVEMGRKGGKANQKKRKEEEKRRHPFKYIVTKLK